MGRADRPDGIAQPLRRGWLQLFVGDETIFVSDAQGIEKRRHHRPLVVQVIRHEQPGRHHFRDGTEIDEMTGLLLSRQRLHAANPELDPLRDHDDRLGLLGRGVLVLPKRIGGEQLALGRQPLPQLRGSRNVWHVGHGLVDTLT